MSDTPRTDAAYGSVQLRKESEKIERELTDAQRTIESLRASVRELIFLHEGARAKDVIQRGKDLL